MAMVCCPNGHWYDNSKQKKCSICKNEKAAPPPSNGNGIGKKEPLSAGDIGKTEPVNMGGIGKTEPVNMGGIGKTEPVNMGNIGKTEPVNMGDIGRTELGTAQKKPAPVLDRRPPAYGYVNSDKTVPVIYAKVDESYPVGFVVCIAGSIKGKDYRLHSGDNTIGRDADPKKFDITINEDNNISRESCIIINYNPGVNEFTLSGGSGAQSEAIVKRNNKPVMPKTSVILSAYDKILIGKTKFMFLPLCGDEFIWDD
jgi:hypothetical protein